MAGKCKRMTGDPTTSTQTGTLQKTPKRERRGGIKALLIKARVAGKAADFLLDMEALNGTSVEGGSCPSYRCKQIR